MTWNYDGWASEFRMGIVAPHADIGPEAEIQAMLSTIPSSTHGARVDFSPMHPGGTIDEKIGHDPVLSFVSAETLDPVVASLSQSPLNAIALAFTSSSFKIGHRKEQELLTRLSAHSHGTALHTTGTAATRAIKHLGLTNLAIVAPSWFDEKLCDDGARYFTDQGIDVNSSTPSGPPGGPQHISPASTYLHVRDVVEKTGAESVFIAGNGQRAIGAIEQLERDLPITVLTANQVLLWAALDPQKRAQVANYGSLFTHVTKGS